MITPEQLRDFTTTLAPPQDLVPILSDFAVAAKNMHVEGDSTDVLRLDRTIFNIADQIVTTLNRTHPMRSVDQDNLRAALSLSVFHLLGTPPPAELGTIGCTSFSLSDTMAL